MSYILKYFRQLLGVRIHFLTETAVVGFPESSHGNLIHLTMDVLIIWLTNYSSQAVTDIFNITLRRLCLAATLTRGGSACAVYLCPQVKEIEKIQQRRGRGSKYTVGNLPVSIVTVYLVFVVVTVKAKTCMLIYFPYLDLIYDLLT